MSLYYKCRPIDKHVLLHTPICRSLLAQMAETGVSHRLTTYKIVGHFFGLSYQKISGSNQVNFFFLESVTFQFHPHMLSLEVAQSLKSYGHFSDPGVGIVLSPRHVGFFRVKQIHPSMASERTTRQGPPCPVFHLRHVFRTYKRLCALLCVCNESHYS